VRPEERDDPGGQDEQGQHEGQNRTHGASPEKKESAISQIRHLSNDGVCGGFLFPECRRPTAYFLTEKIKQLPGQCQTIGATNFPCY
jgi:hypothetical protein